MFPSKNTKKQKKTKKTVCNKGWNSYRYSYYLLETESMGMHGYFAYTKFL